MADHQETDHVSGVSTTGHEWDGIKELNNPLPRWWLFLFYACIVWALGYWVLYPAWPTLTGYTTGVLGQSNRADALADVAAGQSARAVEGGALKDATLEQIVADPKMQDFAMKSGKAAFANNCAPCHGAGAVGAVGYPNLQDDDWLWGGKLADIATTLRVGIRSGHKEARDTQMRHPEAGRNRQCGGLCADAFRSCAGCGCRRGEGQGTLCQ